MDSDAKGLLGRPVRDYRWLNSQTLDTGWPAPQAEEVLLRAQAGHYHTALDCVWGFTQVEVDEATSVLLALATRRGLLQPRVLYFGPKQGPGLFQGLMDSTFSSLRGDNGENFTAIFMDDVSISTERWENEVEDQTFDRHVRHVEIFLTRARERKVQFKMSKSKFAWDELPLLGFRAGRGTRQVDPHSRR